MFTPEAVERSMHSQPSQLTSGASTPEHTRQQVQLDYSDRHPMTQPLTASLGASIPQQSTGLAPVGEERMSSRMRGKIGSALADALHSAMESTIDVTCMEGPPARRDLSAVSKSTKDRQRRGELPGLTKAEKLMDIVSEQVEASKLRVSDPSKPIDW